MRGFGFGARYRQTKYGANYDRENNDQHPNWGWVVLALLVASPFVASMMLNPFMWVMVFLVWLAWKLVHGFNKKGE